MTTVTVTQTIVEVASLNINEEIRVSQVITEIGGSYVNHEFSISGILVEIAYLYTQPSGRRFGPALQCGG